MQVLAVMIKSKRLITQLQLVDDVALCLQIVNMKLITNNIMDPCPFNPTNDVLLSFFMYFQLIGCCWATLSTLHLDNLHPHVPYHV